MEYNKEEVGVEIITSQDNGWGVDFDESPNINQGKIWQDPFADPGNSEAASVESDKPYDEQEPLLEKEVESIPDEPEEDNTPTIDNPIYFIAKQAVEDGLLPRGTDIPEDVDLEYMYRSYKDSVKPMVESQILSEVEQRLSSAGIKDENLFLLQAIENGTPLDEIYEINKYKKYSSLPDTIDEDDKKRVIKEWYNSRGLSEKEQQRNLDAIDLDDEIDSEFSTAKNFFGNLVEDFDNSQQNVTIEKQRQAQQTQQRNADILKSLASDFTLGNEKLAKPDADLIVSSIYNKEQVQVNGQVYELSPYEQFYIALNNDFEFSLQVFKDFLLKDKKESRIKSQLKNEVENDWLEAYKKAQAKSTSTSSIKRRENNKQDSSILTRTTDTGGLYMEI